VRARLTASGVSEPELSRRIKEVWRTRDDPLKWPCRFARMHDGILVSYYARNGVVLCKALRTYGHAKVVLHELERAARRGGLKVRFEDVKVCGMMAVLDLWGGAEKDARRLLTIDTEYFKKRRYGVHYDPITIHSVTLATWLCSWHLWRTGKFNITGLGSMWCAGEVVRLHLPDILTACGLIQAAPVAAPPP